MSKVETVAIDLRHTGETLSGHTRLPRMRGLSGNRPGMTPWLDTPVAALFSVSVHPKVDSLRHSRVRQP